MTKRECAIVEAYTGICMCSGDNREHFYKYIEEIMGRPMLTHEIFFAMNEIKQKSKEDFVKLCQTSTDY